MGVDPNRQLRLRIDDTTPDPAADPAAPPARARYRRDNDDSGAQDGPSPPRAGRKPDSFYRLAVGAAVLRLDDRASLECNALAQLAVVGRLADERYPGKIWRRGLCLRDLIQEAVDETIKAAEGDDMERVRFVLTRAASGDTLSNIASELGIRRESLSRRLWSRITGLVWERLKPRLLALES